MLPSFVNSLELLLCRLNTFAVMGREGGLLCGHGTHKQSPS